jgi:predicted SnoaL-like aldol condensation-catalyzing enzyme
MAKIALIGASGNAGSPIRQELLDRGHQVCGVARDPAKIAGLPNLPAVKHLKSLIAATVLLFMASPSAALAQSAPRDLAAEEANRKLVVEFYDHVFNKHDVAEGAKAIADGYRQHNPNVPDGKGPFVSFFTGYFKENPDSKAVIARSATDGDLVWLHLHSTHDAKDRGKAVIDIFRVREGKIVEHWDVIQAVPEISANSNTMF